MEAEDSSDLEYNCFDEFAEDCAEYRTQRSRAYRRRQRALHIRWKENFIKKNRNYWAYAYRGMLDKGKIHCSCGLCQRKRRDYGMVHSERKKLAQEDLEQLTRKAYRDRSFLKNRW